MGWLKDFISKVNPNSPENVSKVFKEASGGEIDFDWQNAKPTGLSKLFNQVSLGIMTGGVGNLASGFGFKSADSQLNNLSKETKGLSPIGILLKGADATAGTGWLDKLKEDILKGTPLSKDNLKGLKDDASKGVYLIVGSIGVLIVALILIFKK